MVTFILFLDGSKRGINLFMIKEGSRGRIKREGLKGKDLKEGSISPSGCALRKPWFPLKFFIIFRK
jgi:hypothetical protein